MNPNEASINRNHPDGGQYAFRREGDHWQLTFNGQPASFKHELGALYVAFLLLTRPCETPHAVALALKAREWGGQAGPDDALQEWSMGLEDASRVRALWRRQLELEHAIADEEETEPVKAEALRELDEVTEYLRTSPWRTRQGARRCVNAVTAAIRRFHAHLAGAEDAVLQAFARHLFEHLLIPSVLGAGRAGWWVASVAPGRFIYEPPRGVVWESGERQETSDEVGSPKAEVRILRFEVGGSEVVGSAFERRRPAAVGFRSRFLCAGLALTLLVGGCADPRPLKGGKAAITRKPTGIVEQTVVQGDNASQPSKQDQETIKVRTYTLPAATRIQQSPISVAGPSTLNSQPSTAGAPQTSTAAAQPSTSFLLSAPVPVVEREETRARTELGAAQKDTARDLAAKLSSLKGIVWVGAGLFIFGLASLVYPPLKVIVASVTTSVALMLGGVALIVLPTMVVGNELLILGVVALVVGAWFLAHRHGQLSGLVAASTANPSASSAPSTGGASGQAKMEDRG
jgi:hypothetical protein